MSAINTFTALRLLSPAFLLLLLATTATCLPVMPPTETTGLPDSEGNDTPSALENLISIIESTIDILQPTEEVQNNQQALGERFTCLLHKRAETEPIWRDRRQKACEHFLCLGRPATECRCDNASIEVMCVGYLQSEIRELVLGTQQPLVPPSSVNSSGFACDEEGRDNLLMLIEELDDIKTNPAENNLTRAQKLACTLDYQNQLLTGTDEECFQELKNRTSETWNQVTREVGPGSREECLEFYGAQVTLWARLIIVIWQEQCPQ